MTAGTTSPSTVDRSEFRHILLSGTWIGLATGAAVILYLVVARLLPSGVVAALLETIIVLVAGVAVTFLPGAFAASRTTQGIASAAAIGLWGTVVFMAVDVILLRPFRAYPWTWDALGGGSTWWYLPIWWMLGTFLAWLGALVTAGRVARGGEPAIRNLALPLLAGGVGAALGLGFSRVVYMPVAAGIGFTATLIVFALVVIARRKQG
ncbi:MAG TPA: hypothetical protein VKD28_14190 [Gemmatimonadales bacterium]|nr:hypothetical protein [Gemmatimonadales bacterium]